MKVELYTKDQCIWCDRAKGLLNAYSIDFVEFDLSNDEERLKFYENICSSEHRKISKCRNNILDFEPKMMFVHIDKTLMVYKKNELCIFF